MDADLSNSSTEAVSPHFHPPKRTLPPSETQTSRKKPVLMQRAQSSGIDVTGFSFARPANQPKGFTLKLMPRLAPHASREDVGAVESQKHLARPEKEGPSKSIVGPEHRSIEQYLAEDQPQTAKIPRKDSTLPSAEITSREDQETVNSADGQVVIDLDPESDTVITTRATVNSSIPATVSRATAPQDRDRNVSVIQNPHLPRVSTRPKDALRVSKPRRKNRKAALTRQQRSISSTRSGLHQITEDTLFEMLIDKIRQREENEIAAASIQRRLEVQNLELNEENQDIRHQLEISDLQSVKKDAEIKKHQAQLEDWKVKIRRFKQVVDELGHDHDALKEENERFKATAEILEKEKSELFQVIDDAKLQITRAEGTADGQRKEIAEKEQRISLLEQALTMAQDQEETTKAELINERKRGTTLESYIQNYALTQTKQIGLIRDDQAKLMQEFNAGLDTVAANTTTFKNDIMSELKTMFCQCRDAIQVLNEKYSEEKLEVQEFKDSTRDLIPQIENLATGLTKSVETSNRVNFGVSKTIQDNLNSIETHLGTDSALFQQLAECSASHGWLKDKLGTVEPTLDNLSASVKVMLDSGGNLVRQFGDFGNKLEQAQVPKGNPELERLLTEKFAENMQLQLELQKVTTEIDSLKQLASKKDAKIENLQQSLASARRNFKDTEDRNQVLEIEKMALKGEMELMDQRIRHELATEHAIFGNQIKVQYEERLHTLQAEKDELEKTAKVVMTQMHGVQDSLIEAKRVVDDMRTQRDSQAQETEQRIRELTQSCSEHMTRVDAQTLEIQKHQESEAASCLERNGLQEQLRQAQEKIHELEQTYIIQSIEKEESRVPQANIVPFSALENRLSPSRATSPYGDPADFAMLFMSDELLLSTPHNKGKADKESPMPQLEAVQDSQKPLEMTDPAKIFDIPKDMDPPAPRANTKRKAVNFATQRTKSAESRKKGVITRVHSNEVQSSIQAVKEPEERPAKVTKHINKWTYSRIHASGIEVQHEESTVPSRATKGVQRASPKGLVSASSASEATGRPNTRGRGKPRSRGDRYNARFSQEG